MAHAAFAANISTMFTDRPFAERIQAAAAAGFNAVECQFPYEVRATIPATGCSTATSSSTRTLV